MKKEPLEECDTCTLLEDRCIKRDSLKKRVEYLKGRIFDKIRGKRVREEFNKLIDEAFEDLKEEKN